MLIEFSAKNYRSIRDTQTLSLVKSSGDELADSNSFEFGDSSSIQLLRSAAIFGANASGKSNVIEALYTMSVLVEGSATNFKKGDELPIVPFLFDKKTAKSPSEFEIIFIADGIRYQFGFAADSKRIHEEWLIAYPHGKPNRLYSRKYDRQARSYEYYLGRNLSGRKSTWKDSTRENALFLSTAVQLNAEQLFPVYDWFRYNLRMTSNDWGSIFSAKYCQSADSKPLVIKLLQAVDLDIHDIEIVERKLSKDDLPSDFLKFATEDGLDDILDRAVRDVYTVHKTQRGELVKLRLEEESDGTQKIFSLAGPLIDVLRNGYVVVIDELHNNLHPNLVEYLVKLFNDPDTNLKNAQIVFSTHETFILNQEVLRRDQFWFCEKDRTQATSLFPLTEFSPRKERENLELGYLSGRYGALPYTRKMNLNGN